MPFPVLPVIGAGASALSGYLSGKGQADANRRNIKLAREQMAFQERMSGTSYQRAVEDMRIAGINPMLAIQQGGASTPGGAKAETQSTLGPAVSSASAVARMSAEIASIKANIALTDANTRKANVEADQLELRSPLIDAAGDIIGAGMDYGRANIGRVPGLVRRGAMAYTAPFRAVGRGISSSAKSFQEAMSRAVGRIRRQGMPSPATILQMFYGR